MLKEGCDLTEGNVLARGTRSHEEKKSLSVTIPRHTGQRCRGHTCHVELNSSSVQWLRSRKAALTPPASCLLLLPFWSLSKGTFLVMCWLRNQQLVTQELEFTMKFMSMDAAFKVTKLENNRSSINPKTDWPDKHPG